MIIFSSPPPLNTVVEVGFQESEYSIIESGGSVTVCAELDGVLDRPVSISLSTPTQIESGAAEGIYI